MPKSVTVRHALVRAGLAPIDAQALLACVLERDRAWLIAHATEPLAAGEVERFFALARRRREGEPVSYLTGRREFWGLTLVLDNSVLIPRPETETVVECVLLKLPLPADHPVRILDLGTGSGAIAIAVAHERRDATVIATDRSAAALAVARGNAQRLHASNVQFIRADWYHEPAIGDGFDIIASNPPYVADGDPHLREGDVRFEPPSALTSGPEGLDALRVIIGGARDRLRRGGWLVIEHGYDQAASVRELLNGAGFAELESVRDLSGIPRVAAGRAR